VVPSLLYVKAQILIGPNPESVDSYRDHFFRNRVRFFTVSLLVPLAASVTPMVEGHSFETSKNLLPLVAPGIAINVVGLAFRDPRVHAVLVALGLVAPTAGLLFVEVALSPSG